MIDGGYMGLSRSKLKQRFTKLYRAGWRTMAVALNVNDPRYILTRFPIFTTGDPMSV